MRNILWILILFSFVSTRAQTYAPLSSMNYVLWHPFPLYNFQGDSNHVNQKWQFSTYRAMSAGFGNFYGVPANFVSAPIGLQVSRALNNNLYAFTGVSVAPSFYNFSSSFTSPFSYPSFPGGYPSNAYRFGMDAQVEMGLMYINDAKTFSISGSIGVERSSLPLYQSSPNPGTTKRQ